MTLPLLAGAVLAAFSPAPQDVEVRRDGIGALAEVGVLDHRYAPPWWQTSICLPDDPQKTLVGREGELLDDWGGGPYSGFWTRIAARPRGALAGATPAQRLLDPRVPIVETVWQLAGGERLVGEAFAVVPGSRLLPRDVPAPGIEVTRLDAATGLDGWADPPEEYAYAFRSIAVGWNRPIRYRVGAGAARVVLGICEGHWREPGRRILVLRVEGAADRRLDPVAELGPDRPGVFSFAGRDGDGDGAILVEVAAAPGTPDRNTILNALWVLDPEVEIEPRLLLEGGDVAGARLVDCDAERPTPPRVDLLVLRAEAGALAVDVEVGAQRVGADADAGGVALGSRSSVTVSRPPASARVGDASRVWTFELEPGEAVVVALANGFGLAAGVSPEEAALEQRRAADWWRALDLPYDTIELPDPALQALLDASIRNIYQAREIDGALPAFQVGPTCYRGLWVVDGAFLLEAVSFLGRAGEARAGIDKFLTYQQGDGRFELLPKYWKETGIILWVLDRHARLTGDDDWLRSKWAAVRAAVGFVAGLRREVTRDPEDPLFGLLPAGFTDGGIGGVHPEYTNVYWSLVGLQAAVAAARRLGERGDAERFGAELDDFLGSFRRAAARDLIAAGDDPSWLPIVIGDERRQWNPQAGQWGFCHFVFPGKVLPADDPLIAGNLALLDRSMHEGQVRGTGWLHDGIWNYFASFHAHALLWTGRAADAAAMLYAFANHASPLGCWREEQSVQGAAEVEICGDMPHNWASAELIRLVRHLCVLERGDELHLCEGVPPSWLVPDRPLRLRGVATEFGPLDLELRVARDGGGTLHWRGLWHRTPARIVVHLGAWADEVGEPRVAADGWFELAFR